MKVKCKHCGRELMRARTTKRTNGWTHVKVDGQTITEACRINPVTLADARGTTYAEPAEVAA